MNILNLNSYYLSSSLYKPMEEYIKKNNIEISTYVPVVNNYEVREEIIYPLAEHVKVLECYNKIDRGLFFVKQHKMKKALLQLFDLKKFDLLHAHSLFTNGYLAYSLNKKYKIPYVLAVRNTDINLFFKKMYHLRNTGLKIMLRAQKIVFLSKSYKEECIEKYIPEKYKNHINNKAVIIPNGIDDFWFNNKLIETRRKINTPYKFIFVGDDSKRKNLHSLIAACDIILEKGYDIELNIVGKVSEKTRELLGEKSYIKLIGRINREKLLQLYRENDIFVLPSIRETFGLVYPEAMSQGLPVIYTSGQGFDGHFGEGVVGYSVNSLDPKDISDKILKSIDKYAEISERNITLVDKFKWSNIVKEYSRLYENAI